MFARTIMGAAALVLAAAPLAYAHHGWGWAEQATYDVSGTVKTVKLGLPHGTLTLVTDKGETWAVEVGQPDRNSGAGLKDAMLAPGAKLTIHGNRAKDHGRKLIKATRVIIDGKSYNLYPDRA